MKKIILGSLIFIATSSMANYDTQMSERVNQFCQHLLYDNGGVDYEAGLYMGEHVDTTFYTIDEENVTDFYRKAASKGDVVKRACREALANNNNTISFVAKYKFGLSVTIDKSMAEYSFLE